MTDFVTKDSGERVQFETGMVRDTEDGKPRFDLLQPGDLPYEERMLTRWAMLMARGAQKYGERNWEKARTFAERTRALASFWRHAFQWAAGMRDEDHAAAIFFNVSEVEMIDFHKRQGATSGSTEEASGQARRHHGAESNCEACGTCQACGKGCLDEDSCEARRIREAEDNFIATVDGGPAHVNGTWSCVPAEPAGRDGGGERPRYVR